MDCFSLGVLGSSYPRTQKTHTGHVGRLMESNQGSSGQAIPAPGLQSEPISLLWDPSVVLHVDQGEAWLEKIFFSPPNSGQSLVIKPRLRPRQTAAAELLQTPPLLSGISTSGPRRAPRPRSSAACAVAPSAPQERPRATPTYRTPGRGFAGGSSGFFLSLLGFLLPSPQVRRQFVALNT